MNTQHYIFLSTLLVACCTGGIYALNVQDAEATGCPSQFVTEHIDNAINAFEDGNNTEVQNQLNLAKGALAQFSAEDQEDDE